MSEIDLRHLRYFVTVAESGSFVGAARLAGVSQPAITKGIQRMERWFERALFERGPECKLTDFGRTILSRAKQVLAEYEDLQHRARMFEGMEIGSLRVGAGPLMAESLMGLAVGRLIREHPLLRVTIMVDDYSRLPMRLREREIDLFLADVTTIKAAPDLTITPVASHPFVWFCRKGHPLAKKRSVSLADLLAFPIALPELPAWAVKWFEENAPMGLDSQDEAAPFTPTVMCSHLSTIREIVLTSDAVSALTTIALDKEGNRDHFARIDYAGDLPSSNPGVVHLKRRDLSPAASRLIEAIRVESAR